MGTEPNQPSKEPMRKSAKTWRKKKMLQQYMSFMHAVQSGIATLITKDIERGNTQDVARTYGDNVLASDNDAVSSTSIKHLRVGVDSCMVSDNALVSLLIAKGVFTEQEHLEALVAAAEREMQLKREAVADYLGVPVDKIHLL